MQDPGGVPGWPPPGLFGPQGFGLTAGHPSGGYADHAGLQVCALQRIPSCLHVDKQHGVAHVFTM